MPAVPPSNRCWLSAQPGIEAWSSRWSGRAAPRHSHDAYQISLTGAGEGRFGLPGRGLVCARRELALIEAGEVHETLSLGPSAWEFDTLYLDEEALRRVAGSPGRRPSLTGATDDRTAASFSRLHRAVVAGSPVLEQDDGLVDLVRLLGQNTSGLRHPRPRRTALVRVREFLDECPESGPSLADLAAMADLSPSHLSRSFRRAFGLPPHAYLVQARVRRARALLRRGTPVAEAAARAGFADQAHLTRHFRRLVGVTPGAYRAGEQDRSRPAGTQVPILG